MKLQFKFAIRHQQSSTYPQYSRLHVIVKILAKMAPARPAAIKPSPLRKQANTKTSISRKSSALSQPRSNLSKSASSSVISHSQPKSKSSAKPPKPEKSVKPQKPIFKGLSLIIAGTILNSAGTAMSHDSIVQWWKLHGGAWDKEVQVRTTHLICSIDEYKAKGVQGKLSHLRFLYRPVFFKCRS